MKRTLATAAILAMAVFAASPVIPTAPAAPATPATQPAGQADVPVKQVVLFSSGVGYFEHFGTVRDNGATELRFKTDQINDVLKSLVLQDLDKGTVGAVTYPSQEPIEKTLKSFQVNITNNPPLADLLNQLRGAKITVAPAGPGEQELRGTIVGVEKRQERITNADGRPQVVDTWVLNLKVAHRFRSIPMTQVKEFALEDPTLEEELDKALSALAQSRDQDKKPVSINFRGQGERRVRIGYVVETPIWKTSYRLILGGAGEKPVADAPFSGRGSAAILVLAAKEADAAPTAEQSKSLRAEAEVLKSWAELASPQYGESHPSIAFIAGRAKAIDEALAKGKLPATVPPPEKPKTALERRELEDELEVHKQWFDGMAKGYGKEHPAIVTMQKRIEQIEAALSDKKEKPPEKKAVTLTGATLILAAAPGAGAAAPATKTGKLQGWAIVENQTDNDWNDVQLSLVSGRPLSYIQDLYHPLYIPRPVVFPNLYASLRPQTYQGGITEQEEQKLNEKREQQNAQNQRGANQAPARAGGGGGGGGLFGGSSGKPGVGQNAVPETPLDPTASVISAASAAQLGELFEYTVGNVSLARQRSAMIPIVTDEIDVEKVSIYNAEVLPSHPLTGAKVKNTTKKHLLQGPVTVLEGGAYAGDARIDDVPPGQSRFLSYGIDLNVLVDPNVEAELPAVQRIQAAKIAQGVLEVTSRNQSTQTYKIQNKGDLAKTVIIEHPRESDWRLVEPAQVEETTDQVHRLRVRVEPHKTAKLNVKAEGEVTQQWQLLPNNADQQLLVYAREGEIPEPVRKALDKVIGMKAALTETQRQVDLRKKEITEVTAEQQRMRENMKTVAQNTEYYTRLLTKLNDQETRIEQLQKEIGGYLKTQETQKKDLEEYVGKLNV